MISRRNFIVSLACASVAASPAWSETRRSSAIVTAQALGRINKFRARRRLDPLIIDPRAEQAALSHAKEMALLGELKHSNLKARLAEFEIVTPSAENIAVGQPSVGAVLKAWENSRGHRNNLLGAYNRTGLAVARNANSGNLPYWTLILSV